MGRLLAGLLALCFVVDPIVGVSAWLQIEKAIVRREVRRHIVSGLDKDGLVLLEFARSETEPLLRWEHSGEFEYYRCFWDRAETRLNNRMRELAVRSHGDAPKFGGAEGFGRSTPGSPVFVVTREWEIPPPRSPARRPGGISERFSSRNIPPLAPPPWPV
jgi:hypothetical protein